MSNTPRSILLIVTVAAPVFQKREERRLGPGIPGTKRNNAQGITQRTSGHANKKVMKGE